MENRRKTQSNTGRVLLSIVMICSLIFALVIFVKDKVPALGRILSGNVHAEDVSVNGDTNDTGAPSEAQPPDISPEPAGPPSDEPQPPDEPEGPKLTRIRIRCAGDVMCHNSQLKAAKRDDGYSFDSWFDYVRDLLADADVTMMNIETTFPGSNYYGYPSFRSPDELCEAIAACGTDIGVIANNHMLDSGVSGFLRSIDIIRANGMLVAGGYPPGEETYTIMETVDGVKLGVVAYVYENFEQNGRRCLNGCYIPYEVEDTVNSFRYYNEGDMQEIRDTVAACREAGADIVMAFMHWGEEYFIEPMKSQQDLAQIVVDAGVDFVVGSHPHVPERIVWLTNTQGVEVPVYYSLGNFVSNQRTETLGSTMNKVHTEEGLIANIEICYNHDTGEIVFEDVSAIPCWVEKYTKAGTSDPNYWIIPLIEGYQNNPELLESGHLSRAEQALKNITAIIGEDYIWKPDRAEDGE